MVKRIPAHPGGFIRRNYLEPLGITVVELADALSVRRAALVRLLDGKSDLSPELATRISLVLGGSPGSWMNMQTNHSLAKLAAGSASKLDTWRPKVALKDGVLVAVRTAGETA